MLSLRPTSPADEEFRFSVYTSTRSEELSQWGWPPEQQNIFLRLQFNAQEHGYKSTFPDAARSLIYLGDQPIGILVVNRTAEEIRLVDLALLPAFRARGFGRQIIETLQVEAHVRHQPLRLQVLGTNRARLLYERLGFISMGDHNIYIQMEWRGE